jgi:hypothetical protein
VRSVAAVLAGWTVAVVGYQIGAIVALLAFEGIPLGATGAPPGPGYFAANLLFAAAAAVGAGWLVVRIAPPHAVAHAAFVAGSLAAFVLWGFTRPSSQWPDWYAPTLAGIVAVSPIAGAVGGDHRRRSPARREGREGSPPSSSR